MYEIIKQYASSFEQVVILLLIFAILSIIGYFQYSQRKQLKNLGTNHIFHLTESINKLTNAVMIINGCSKRTEMKLDKLNDILVRIETKIVLKN